MKIINRPCDICGSCQVCGAKDDEDCRLTKQCTAVASANEYCKIATRCERLNGHTGPHVAELSESSRRIWEDISFRVNY